MADNSFFDESSEQSRVKAMIVAKYFDAWAKVITRQQHVSRIAYMDLFAGPGRYQDGTMSTPLLVLDKAIADPVLRQKLVCVFNDKNEQNTADLENAIKNHPGIDQLRYKPEVQNEEVGSEIVKEFEAVKLVPTLFFVDPWGYKGLSLGLVNAVVKDWACECIFFFNYSRINMGLSNPFVVDHMNALFGSSVADDLRRRLAAYPTPRDRELDIVETLCHALNPDGNRFVLPFAFKADTGMRTTHHLIFVSKSVLGYSIMKEIMAKESSGAEQGVPNFVYNPADKRFPVLFEYDRPLDELQGMLMKEFHGQTLSVQSIFERHNVGKRFIKKNYKDVIMSMEGNFLVTTSRTDQNRKRGQCPDHVFVSFME
jgi:three-Cys-motif partner protein